MRIYAISLLLGVSFTANANALELQEGQCIGKVFKPAVYKNTTMKYKKNDASQVMSVKPAQFRVVEKKIEIAQAYTTKKVVPATYKYVTEKVIEKQAHVTTTTKKDRYSGEVICKVKVPATYKHIQKKVIVESAKTVEVTVPPRYQVVQIRELTQDEEVMVREIPEQYQEYSKREMVTPAQYDWQEVLCQQNSDHATVKQLQQALKQKGYNPGRVDGVLGKDTYTAVNRFQKRSGLAQGSITYEVLNQLGVVAAH